MNPRKRKLVKSGEMKKIIDQENMKDQQVQSNKVATPKEEGLLVETPVVNNDEIDKKSIDPFIAKELKEIERIPSNKKKPVKRKVKKTTTTKKTNKKKTGDK